MRSLPAPDGRIDRRRPGSGGGSHQPRGRRNDVARYSFGLGEGLRRRWTAGPGNDQGLAETILTARPVGGGGSQGERRTAARERMSRRTVGLLRQTARPVGGSALIKTAKA